MQWKHEIMNWPVMRFSPPRVLAGKAAVELLYECASDGDLR
jgi:hypothetical protein